MDGLIGVFLSIYSFIIPEWRADPRWDPPESIALWTREKKTYERCECLLVGLQAQKGPSKSIYLYAQVSLLYVI